MARTASQALGGFYETPPRILPYIAEHIGCPVNRHLTLSLLDPCAGKGAAILEIAHRVTYDRGRAGYEIYAVEAEEKRANELSRIIKESNANSRSVTLHGDAFQLSWGFDTWKDGVDLLFLNPPYDHDKTHKRLEEKFLQRFTKLVRPNGLLVFVVPFHALAASAHTLASHYHTIACYRFPEPEWNEFKQVVLFGVCNEVPDFIQATHDQIVQWSEDAESIPVLEHPEHPSYVVPLDGSSGLKDLEILDLDIEDALQQAPVGTSQHWMGLQRTPDELIGVQFPVAEPARPVHIAMAIASGAVSGQEVTATTPGLPKLMVNGSFQRETVTVDTNTNKEGKVTGYVQVEQPKLQVSVLDMETWTYHDLATGAEPTGATNVADFNIADLLEHYQDSLAEALRNQCPPLYDPTNPEDQVVLPETARTLYTMQERATQACLKLLRNGDNPFLLGEVGTGKTGVALTTALAYGAKRIAVVCPPHLTKSWTDQAAAVLPGAVVQVVNAPSDMPVGPKESDEPGAGMVIYVLSQTVAKLGHAMDIALLPGNRCPVCNTPQSATAKEIVNERRRCQHRNYIPMDDVGKLCVDIAHLAVPCGAFAGSWLVRSRMLNKKTMDWETYAPTRIEPIIRRLGDMLIERPDLWKAFSLLVTACPEEVDLDDQLADLAERMYMREGISSYVRGIARNILLLMQNSHRLEKIAERWKASNTEKVYSYSDPWPTFFMIARGDKVIYQDGPRRPSYIPKFMYGNVIYSRGDIDAVGKAFRILDHLAEWERGEPCNTPLYQSTPNPRRYPMAIWLRKRKHLYDFVLLDEAQEYRTKGSAQEKAAHRLCEGKPTILLSGSIMSGKASSLFSNMWAVSKRFRGEFGRDQMTEFITRYGYRKILVEVPQDKAQNISVYGAQSDRVQELGGKIRNLGEAPGVLPLFVLTHLMRQAVWMHKADLDNELPPAYETREEVAMLQDQAEYYEELQGAVVKQVVQDRFDKLLAGRLLGALGQVPSYADLCTSDVGNGTGTFWTVRYPEHIGIENPVAAVPLLPTETDLPKEQWLINKVRSELAEDRNVVVFVYHTGGGLPQRLQRVLKNAGIDSSYLNSHKVKAKDGVREAWLDHEIANGCRVLLVNPTAVQTGLNNLVHFCTALWYEPICDAIIWRQANGRLDRIGQTKEVRIIAAVYAACTQVDVLDLNAAKVEVSMQVDGLSTAGALKASGAAEGDEEMAYTLGQALFNRITDPDRQKPRLPRQPTPVQREPVQFKSVPAWQAQKGKRKKKPKFIEVEAEQLVMF